MAIINKTDLKNMNESTINGRLSELKKELMKLNAQRAVGTAVENPGKIKELRRSIAKLLTIKKIKSKNLGGNAKA